MALFSQRTGIRPLSKAIQRESIDDDLRNALWTSFYESFVKSYSYDAFEGRHPYAHYPYQEELDTWLLMLWTHFLKRPSDTKPEFDEAVGRLRSNFFKADWHWVFDFLEFSAKQAATRGPVLIDLANRDFERENSAYRFVGSEIVEITDKSEIRSIEDALSGPKAARLHIERAVALLSDRRKPDFRNSIKESISAVEAICRLIAKSQSDTLGAAVKKLSAKTPLHPAFEQAILKLYGFTSDEGGIRHALMEEPSLSYADAKFMLVLCSAFGNFILAKCAENRIELK
jgi:AbiJ N-terminal domain 4